MPPIRTDNAGLGMLVAGGTVFIFLCTVPALMTIDGLRLHMDALLFSCLRGGLAFAGAFVVGHLILRKARRGGRAGYAVVGALAMAIAYATQMRGEDLRAIAAQGLIAYFFILPVLVGAGMGFLYAFKAGWEIGDDSPEALAEALGDEGKAAVDAPARVQAGETEYFNGPLRVRTSFPLMLLSAVLAAGIAAAARSLFVMGWEVNHLADRSNASVIDHAARISLYLGLEAAFLILIGVVPIVLGVLAAHFAARAFKTHAHWACFVLGLIAPLALALVSMGFFLGIGLAAALPTAIAMALYRSFAGLEPVPVREDILVSDPRDLVAANHPRRQFGRVIRSR